MDFIAFDTEDDSKERMERCESGFNKQVTQIAALSTARDDFHARGPSSVPKFLRWLRDGSEAFAYAHNTQYDLGNLFGRDLDAFDQTLVGGRFIKARWKGTEFRDTFNLWPMRLKKVGKVFGLKKGDLDVRSKEYVMGDVKIVKAAVEFLARFCRGRDLEYVPTTLGGLAMAIWQGTEGSQETVSETSDFAREALYGGRVELWKAQSESGRVMFCDLNSLYPFCMTREFPGALQACRHLPKWGIAEATVKVARKGIPVLPLRRRDGSILYAYGRFRGVWTIEELRFAEEHGTRIERVWQCQGTDETVRPYREFVEETYRRRLAARTEPERLMWKLVLNNLYGRIGATGVITRSLKLTTKNKHAGTPYGSKTLVDMSMPLDETVNWAHAAYVTAYARIELWRYLDKVGLDRLVYADTDSVIFDWEKGRALPFATGRELGQMKLVATSDRAATYAPKTYTFGRRSKAKGVPRRLAGRFIREGKVSFEIPFRMREAVLFYDRQNARQLSVWRRVTRERLSGYDRKTLEGNRFKSLTVLERG